MRKTATNPRWMILSLLLTLSCAGLPAFGQQNETDIQIGKSVVVQSKVLNRDLRISVYLPSNYATSGIKYPVLYDPNDFLFKYDAGTVELLSIMNFIPPMIVVALVPPAKASAPPLMSTAPPSITRWCSIRFFSMSRNTNTPIASSETNMTAAYQNVRRVR